MRLLAAGGLVAGAGILLARLLGDVEGKPLFEDEAVSGLISARPVSEIVVTTLWDRGGAPLHFLLVHVAFAFDSSPEALRSLSVVFALAALVPTFDLGRRLGGPAAGATAALVAAGSGMLAIYGSFGRMYALLAFAGALAGDLFVRALQERTRAAAATAAAAAWLLPAVHPYGGIVVALEALVGLAVWRGRPLRAGLPAAAVTLAMLPFAIADLRLASRFEVSGDEEGRLATRREALSQLEAALRGFGGGEGALFVLFLVLAAAGLVLVARREPAFAMFAVLAFAAPPLLATLVRTARAPDLSPRHLIFALPAFAAFVGVAVAWGARGLPPPVQALGIAAVAVTATLAPQGIPDPRAITYTAALGSEQAVSEPAALLQREIRSGDVLYPYSSVFLAALPEAGEARGLPRGQAQSLLAAVRRVEFPARAVWVAVPTGTTPVDAERVTGALPFARWLLVRATGPFPDEAAVLQAAQERLVAAREALEGRPPEPLVGWFDLNVDVLCESLATLGHRCGIR